MATASNKPKPKVVPKSAKSDKPVLTFKKFTILIKSAREVTVQDIEDYVADSLVYDFDAKGEYVITDGGSTQAEFDAAWDAA